MKEKYKDKRNTYKWPKPDTFILQKICKKLMLVVTKDEFNIKAGYIITDDKRM